MLLVEDSRVLVERLRELVDAVPGVRLHAVVETELEALSVLERDGVDAVILDLQLRRGTGFGVLRGVAAMAARPVVIVYTNYDLPEYRRQAAALGAEHFLDKSRDYDRLRSILGAIGAAV